MSTPKSQPVVTPVDDNELGRLRRLFAEEPPTHGPLRGLARILEPLYDDILREKASKHWSWKHIAVRLTEWGYPVSANYLAKVFAHIEQRRLMASRPKAARSASKSATLSVRRTGPTHGAKRTEVLTHASPSEAVFTDIPASAEPVAVAGKPKKSASVTPLRPFPGNAPAKIAKQL